VHSRMLCRNMADPAQAASCTRRTGQASEVQSSCFSASRGKVDPVFSFADLRMRGWHFPSPTLAWERRLAQPVRHARPLSLDGYGRKRSLVQASRRAFPFRAGRRVWKTRSFLPFGAQDRCVSGRMVRPQPN
jgi:hypothetical protein